MNDIFCALIVRLSMLCGSLLNRIFDLSVMSYTVQLDRLTKIVGSFIHGTIFGSFNHVMSFGSFSHGTSFGSFNHVMIFGSFSHWTIFRLFNHVIFGSFSHGAIFDSFNHVMIFGSFSHGTSFGSFNHVMIFNRSAMGRFLDRSTT